MQLNQTKRQRQIHKNHQPHQLLHWHHQTTKMLSQRHCLHRRYVWFIAKIRCFTCCYCDIYLQQKKNTSLFDSIENNNFFLCFCSLLYVSKLIGAHFTIHTKYTQTLNTKHRLFSMQNILIDQNKKIETKKKHQTQFECTIDTHKHTAFAVVWRSQRKRSQAFNNTQRPARNPEIAQNPSTNNQTPNSNAPPSGVFNRFGNADDDDNSSVDPAQSVAVCLANFKKMLEKLRSDSCLDF